MLDCADVPAFFVCMLAVLFFACIGAYEAGQRRRIEPWQRDNRQRLIASWVERAFGKSTVSLRALRLLEEAIEVYQAAEGDSDQAHRLIDHVFSKPAGTIAQEIGGVGVTTLALAAVAGLSADIQEQREVARVLALPVEHFKARNAAKVAAGFGSAQ